MLTDGAVCGFDGVLLAVENKVLGLPAQGIAICTTGYGVCDLSAENPFGISNTRIIEALEASGMGRNTPHHDALRILPFVLRRLHQQNLRSFADLDDVEERSSILMTVAAWDPTDGVPKTYVAGTEPMNSIHPPYALARVHHYLTSPSHSVTINDILGKIDKREHDLASPDSFDVRRDGLRLLDAQRSFKGGAGGDNIYGVGGRAYLTEVSATGITIEEFHEWAEDRVGFPIRPARI